MLILIYFFLVNVAIPQIVAYTQALAEPMMTILIAIVGIIIMLSAVGLRVSQNLGSTIVGGIFHALGYICRTIIQALGWILRNTFSLLPRIFNGSRNTFIEMGLNNVVSILLSVLVSIIFLALVI